MPASEIKIRADNNSTNIFYFLVKYLLFFATVDSNFMTSANQYSAPILKINAQGKALRAINTHHHPAT